MIRRRILLAAVLAVLFGIGWGVGRGRAGGDLYRNLDTFVEVLHAVQASYVDPVQPRPLIEGGLRGMLQSLDPYSRFLSQAEYEGLRGTLDEQFEGIGLLLDVHQGAPIVVTPVEGSPAWEAGLLPGDVISKVDGHSTLGHTLADIAGWLKGPAGKSVTLQVLRTGETEPLDLTLVRRTVDAPSVTAAFLPEPGIGYVRLSSFGEHAGAELGAAIDSLRLSGARALVLDLRGNPGGLVAQAIEVVQPFVREGSLVVTTRGRAAPERKFLAARARTGVDWPLAVLIDGGSASASEIVAGSLQDVDRALVVGQHSFGKGSVQDVMPLRNREGAIQLTTAWYHTPSGRSLQAANAAAAADDEDEEDAASDDSTSAPRSDTATAAVFHTASGRVVHAGGVEPDLEVKPDTLPPLTLALEGRRVAFRFAKDWVPAHGASADTAAVSAYRKAAAAAGVTITDAGWERERDAIERGLRRELARRAGGAAAAARIELERDPVWARAAVVLRQAHSASQVFAIATGKPVAPAPVRRSVRGK